MNIKICAVVTGSNMKEFLYNLEHIQKLSNMVELYVDNMRSLNINDVKTIKSVLKSKAIMTCRKRPELINQIFDLGFDYIDMDIKQASLFTFSRKRKTKIILSFHDFHKTPSLQILKNIKKEMKEYKPDIMKIATMVNANRDINTLIHLLMDKNIDEQMIVLGMGNKGKITRILSPLLGGYLTFASTKYSSTASGQIDIKSLRKWYSEYYYENN